MKKTTEKIRVSGKGNSKKDAFAAALNGVQGGILKETDDVILRIEPMNVTVVEAKEEHWTEKFLFFFFPRQRTLYKLTLEVEVQCEKIEIENFNFISMNKEAEGLRIPIINKYI